MNAWNLKEAKERYERVKAAKVCTRCRLPKDKHPIIEMFMSVEIWKGKIVMKAANKEEKGRDCKRMIVAWE